MIQKQTKDKEKQLPLELHDSLDILGHPTIPLPDTEMFGVMSDSSWLHQMLHLVCNCRLEIKTKSQIEAIYFFKIKFTINLFHIQIYFRFLSFYFQSNKCYPFSLKSRLCLGYYLNTISKWFFSILWENRKDKYMFGLLCFNFFLSAKLVTKCYTWIKGFHEVL